jgi:dTDP-glucose 4,6-dehydratase
VRTLVTGAAGFIGSAYVEGRIEFIEGAIEDPAAVQRAMQGCELVVNFAAETHVDRSISGPDPFAVTHVLGTGVLLDATRELGVARYIQVSTDEVYGSIARGSFTEDSPLRPSSPYSATKAAGDLLVQAHVHTHGIHAVICRGSNSYGPRQHPEKLIPLCALNALHGDALPVYGDGRQVRNWLYVDDFARAIDLVAREGAAGEVYNAGGPDEEENVRVVERILELTGADSSLIEHVEDRKGHDRRYSLSSDKMKAVGWVPQVAFEDGLERTVAWYRENEWWWQPIRSGEYREYYERQYGRSLG